MLHRCGLCAPPIPLLSSSDPAPARFLSRSTSSMRDGTCFRGKEKSGMKHTSLSFLRRSCIVECTYLEPSVFFPICPTRLTETVLHVRWSPSVPLWTLDDLTALAWLATDSNHKYSRIITHHAAVTITVQNAGRFSVTVAITIAKRYNRGGGRCSGRRGGFVVIRYINLL